MSLENFTYKGFKVKLDCSKGLTAGDDYDFHCSWAGGYGKPKKTATEAKKNIKADIDMFLSEMPPEDNWQAWAEHIEDRCIVWDGYEDCHIDPQTLKVVLNNYLKLKSK